jgi:hypothetical protein
MYKIFITLLALYVTLSTAMAGKTDDKSIGLGLGIGEPQLIYGELSIIRLKYIHFGFNYGSLPLNSIVTSAVNMNQITAPRQIADNITLTPIPTASIRSFSAFARFFPWAECFYIQTALQGLNLEGSVSGAVTNQSTGRYITSVSAALRLTIPMIGLSVGWQRFITSNFYLDFGIGAVFLTKAEKSFSLGGISLAAYDETLYSQILAEQQKISSQIDSTLDSFIKKVPIIPMLYFSMGVAF